MLRSDDDESYIKNFKDANALSSYKNVVKRWTTYIRVRSPEWTSISGQRWYEAGFANKLLTTVNSATLEVPIPNLQKGGVWR